MDQDPVARADAAAVAVQQAHVDVAPNARDVDLGQPVLSIHDLDDLARDRQAHESRSTTWPAASGVVSVITSGLRNADYRAAAVPIET